MASKKYEPMGNAAIALSMGLLVATFVQSQSAGYISLFLLFILHTVYYPINRDG